MALNDSSDAVSSDAGDATETDEPNYTKRSEWEAPKYRIKEARLVFDIQSSTRVELKTLLDFELNPDGEDVDGIPELSLDCAENLDLTRLAINGTEMSESSMLSEGTYVRDAGHIKIQPQQSNFQLEATTILNPAANKAGLGLFGNDAMYVLAETNKAFSHMTPFIDEQSNIVSKWTTEIIACKEEYPAKLANGELISDEDLPDDPSRSRAIFESDSPMPGYLFALAAGKLVAGEESTYRTGSGREIKLQVYCEENEKEKCAFAMFVLKKALEFAEKTGGMECEAKEYKVVAAPGFIHGAMEGKYFNLFSPGRLLLTPMTSRYADYLQAILTEGHEVIHDQNGNTVYPSNSFHVAGKEGPTSFRDGRFLQWLLGEELGYLARIIKIRGLKKKLFPVDQGATSQPIIIDEYIQDFPDCYRFAYGKAGEVLNMMRVLIGDEAFDEGLAKYLKENKGKAVPTEALAAILCEMGPGFDYDSMIKWYYQKGTPRCTFNGVYNPDEKTYELTVTQTQPFNENEALYLPIAMALIDSKGNDMQLELADDSERAWDLDRGILLMQEETHTWKFINVEEEPRPSMFRDLSAPVMVDGYSEEDMEFLMHNDKNEVNRYDASQKFTIQALVGLAHQYETDPDSELSVPDEVLNSYQALLNNNAIQSGLLAEMMRLPSMNELLAEPRLTGKTGAVLAARKALKTAIAASCKDRLKELYQANRVENPADPSEDFRPEEIAQSNLKNVCLDYLQNEDEMAIKQFDDAKNMTDAYYAFKVVCSLADSADKRRIIDAFYDQCKNDKVSINLYIIAMATAEYDDVEVLIRNISDLRAREDLDDKDCRIVDSLYWKGFQENPAAFHDASGRGYEMTAEVVFEYHDLIPSSAVRILQDMTNAYPKLDHDRQTKMLQYINELRIKLLGRGSNTNAQALIAKIDKVFGTDNES